ncbi:hypothetical protein G7Z17_g9238 [Cylindrodendrum hubeiense]|uniref:Uncharacterized protein n=1 Tax=Cylindrodendrum hubeiense TaxID=595255 RepID=A0A9P5H1Y7_9HYPO|nr:hypothetical protein G7Z17_g9238 [Cylindrodendrum hubeiense]
MDLCITAQEPFEPPKTKPFTPVVRASPTPTPRTSPHHLHPLAATISSPSSLTPLPHPGSSSHLEFDLVIYDAANDSSLTHPWDLPQMPLRIPLDTTKAQLLSILRTHLPMPPSNPLAATNTVSSDSDKTSSRRRTALSLRRPKLVAVTLYWTFRGAILPLGPDDDDWHYRNPITKTDLLGRSELEWFLLREMMAASVGALKCYLAIRGETPGPKNTGFSWLFGGSG